MQQEVILGAPFLTLLYPFKVDKEGIKTIIKGKQFFLSLLVLSNTKNLTFSKMME